MDGLTEASMFEAVRRHDPKYDGRFYFSATNSEIYCLPSCHVRTPLERNILFFGSKGEAEAAGRRPCKKCRPDLFRSVNADKWYRSSGRGPDSHRSV